MYMWIQQIAEVFFCFFISTLCSHFLVDFICSNQRDHRVWRQEQGKLILDTLIDQIRYKQNPIFYSQNDKKKVFYT